MSTILADSGTETGAVDRRRPGRPRAEDLDDRIMSVALDLIDQGEPVTVNRIVERSGVSRAAIYRRWPALNDLIVAALDQGRELVHIPLDGDLREALFQATLGGASATYSSYPESRMRQRLKLGLNDRALQRAYWNAHVSRRRGALADLLRAGVERGILRDDIDIDGCLDAILGMFYYQIVVRGASWSDPETRVRCEGGLRAIWRGMEAAPTR